ncbi:MAG TPA: hypothetical protein VMH50_05940 [Thermoleophilia bacterium]|nr:hypothetical protein [Thermoleophilia bacterium]
MRQAIAILRRRKWLFIIPFAIVFLAPLLWAFLFMRSYEADSVVWLDSDVSITSVLQDQTVDSQSSTPIQQEADTLLQLLQTRSFLTRVVDTTSLRSKMKTPAQRESTLAFVRKHLGTGVVGPNSLKITFTGRSASQAVEMVGKTTTQFLAWVRRAAQQEGEQSVSFFENRSEQYRVELANATSELVTYRKAHPETRQLDIADKLLTAPNITVPPAEQAEYEKLKSQQEYAQQVYDSSLDDLAKTRSLAAATEERFTDGLRLIDSPVAPTSWKKKDLLLFAMLSFLAAIVIGALVVGIAEVRDTTLRDRHDVEDKLGLQVLAVIAADSTGHR